MRSNYIKIWVGIVFITMVVVVACKKESEEPKNPFDNTKKETTKKEEPLEPSSFLALHNTIFSPICANSGCHDGNFEPDFRTIESSYNTMVNKAAIKTDFAKKWVTRVVPGDSANSILIKRLTIDLNGNSGLMPFDVAKSTGWDKIKDEGIKNIGKWIMDGAKDMYGNSPKGNDFVPTLQGYQIISANGDTLTHERSYKPFLMKNNESFTLWISLKDDITPESQLKNVRIQISDKADIFTTGKIYNTQYVSTPLIANGVLKKPVKHFHKVTIPFADLSTDLTWFRTWVDDGVNGPTMLPNDNSNMKYKIYSSIQKKI